MPHILILGGDGYLGWPTAMRFSQAGHEVTVVDNFSRRRWHLAQSTDSLTPILPLEDRIEAWREVSGKQIEARIGSIEDADAAVGARMVARALEGPLTQIAVNAGMEGGVVVNTVRDLEGNHGLNAATGEYIDLVEAGIIDAAKVTRSALQNAASIAALFLTTEAVIADAPDDGAGGGMPDMDF